MYIAFANEKTTVTALPFAYGQRIRLALLPDVGVETARSIIAHHMQQPRAAIASLSGPLRALSITIAAIKASVAASTAPDSSTVTSIVLSLGSSFGAIAEAFDSWQRMDRMRLNRGVVSQDAAAAAFAALSTQGQASISVQELLELLTYVGATQAPRGNQAATVKVLEDVLWLLNLCSTLTGDIVQVAVCKLTIIHLAELAHWASSQYTPAVNPGVVQTPGETVGKTIADLKKISTWITGSVVAASSTISLHLDSWLKEAPVRKILIDQALLSAEQYHEVVATRLPSPQPFTPVPVLRQAGLYDCNITGTGALLAIVPDAGATATPNGKADLMHPLGTDEKPPMVFDAMLAAASVARLATAVSLAMQAATIREEMGDASATPIPSFNASWPEDSESMIQGVDFAPGYPLLVTTDPRIRVAQGVTSALRLISRRSDRVLRGKIAELDTEVPLVVRGARDAAMMMSVPPLMPVIGRVQDADRSYSPLPASLHQLWSVPTSSIQELWAHFIDATSTSDVGLRALAEVLRFVGVLSITEGAESEMVLPRSGHWYHGLVHTSEVLGDVVQLMVADPKAAKPRSLTFRPFTVIPSTARLSGMASNVVPFSGSVRALSSLPMFRWISSATSEATESAITGWRVAQEDELDLVLLPATSDNGRILEITFSPAATTVRPRPFNCELSIGGTMPTASVSSLPIGGMFDVI